MFFFSVVPRQPLRQTKAANTEHLSALRAFLVQQRVLEAKTWKNVFNAKPPRRTLEQICTRVGAKPVHGFFNYRDSGAFQTELKRIVLWYNRPRRATAQSQKMPRSKRQKKTLVANRKAMTDKVKGHYTRLLKAPANRRHAGLEKSCFGSASCECSFTDWHHERRKILGLVL